MSERPPDVDMVNEEPDILRGLRPPSKPRVSLSRGAPGYRKSRIGIASSVVYACPMFISASSACISRLSSQGFCGQASERAVSLELIPSLPGN